LRLRKSGLVVIALTGRQRAFLSVALGVSGGIGYLIYLLGGDPDVSFAGLRDPVFWASAAGSIAVAALLVVLFIFIGRYTHKALHPLVAKFFAVTPVPMADASRKIAGVVKFLYVAALFWGINAYVYSLMLWRVSSLPSFGDPVLKNPLFWLTWLALTGALFAASIAAAILLREATIAAAGRIRKVFTRKAR
jgi:hypothetical protein